MIIHDGQALRNLQEQVDKNKNDILYILEQEGTLNQFGIRVMAVVKTVSDIPTVEQYKADNPEWSYGDCYMVGESEPYNMYILTRANGTVLNDYWLNIGQFPLAGPKGPKGETGIGIDTMQVINFPSGTPSVTYNTTNGTMVHGTMDLTYMDGDSAVTQNVGNVTMDIPITYGDGLKAEATATNDKLEVKVDYEKVVKKPATVASHNQAVVINNNGDSVGVAVQNSAPTSGSIAQRTADGCLKVADPIANDDAVSLAYLNAHSGGKLDWHDRNNTPLGKYILFQIDVKNDIFVTLSNGETVTLVLSIMAPGNITEESIFFASAQIKDNSYKYYATTGLYSNFGSGYKVFVNIYSVETGDKVGTYTEFINIINNKSSSKYYLR